MITVIIKYMMGGFIHYFYIITPLNRTIIIHLYKLLIVSRVSRIYLYCNNKKTDSNNCNNNNTTNNINDDNSNINNNNSYNINGNTTSNNNNNNDDIPSYYVML